MKVVIACRHGQAYKNLKNIYGGKGSGLTEEGITQVEGLSEELLELVKYLQFPVHIYRSCDRIHVKESSEILRKKLGLEEVETDPQFKPIRLGVFDGMSREKQLELYPEACEAHQKWEKGLIDITESECLIEGAQPALDYYEQLKGFISTLPEKGIYILLGTRSDAACLYNLFQDKSPANYMQYQYYNFGYAEAKVLLERGNEHQMLDIKEVRDRLEQVKNTSQTGQAESTEAVTVPSQSDETGEVDSDDDIDI